MVLNENQRYLFGFDCIHYAIVFLAGYYLTGSRQTSNRYALKEHERAR